MVQRRLDEFAIIARFFAPLAAKTPGALGLTDDAALLDLEPGHELVVTTDTMIEGVHFLPQAPPADVAPKLLRVNLSDLAAMGATARAYTLAAAFANDIALAWIEGFAAALGRDQEAFGVSLIGGDTTATPGPMTFTVTAFGTVPKGRALRRSGARVGDTIYVSGTVGDGALGLLALRGQLPGLAPSHAQALAERYHRPTPRLALGARLLGLAHSAIDMSDGLVADLGHIASTSHVDAAIEWAKVPLSAAARAALDADPGLRNRVLSGGDDYELLFTADPASAAPVARLAEELRLPLTAVGQIVPAQGTAPEVRVFDPEGQVMTLETTGYRHF
jgi:thiamine-monophosphate kinase